MAAVPGEGRRLTVCGSTQMPRAADGMAALKVDKALIRVVTPHVAVASAARRGCTPSNVCAAAAMRLGRPVTWMSTHSEDMLALAHSRPVQYVESAAARTSTFTGLRVHPSATPVRTPAWGVPAAGTKRMSNGTHAFRAIQFDVPRRAPTPPTGVPWRRSPEASPSPSGPSTTQPSHWARPHRAAPAQLAGRHDLPFATLTGITYDSGAYVTPLESRPPGRLRRPAAEQAERRARGDRRLLGIGVACYVEITAGGSGASTAR